MEDESILGGISEIGSAAVDMVTNLGEAQVGAMEMAGDTILEGADRLVAGAAYATGFDDTAQEYRDAANDWATERGLDADDAVQSLSDAGSAVWGSSPPSPEEIGTGGGWDTPAIPDIPAPPGGDWIESTGTTGGWEDTAGKPESSEWELPKPEDVGTGNW